jgi:hypothetical protein
VAEVLAAHNDFDYRGSWFECRCGVILHGVPSTAHAQHQADMLAAADLLAALHPGFDIPGCAAAIHQARHLAPPDQLAHAVIDYARRTDVRTPALLAQDGPHWHTGHTPDARIEPARCAVHEHEWAHCCRACEGDRKAGGDVADTLALSATQAETNERGLALTRAALTEPKETP